MSAAHDPSVCLLQECTECTRQSHDFGSMLQREDTRSTTAFDRGGPTKILVLDPVMRAKDERTMRCLEVLEDLVNRARQGDFCGVMVVVETENAFEACWTPGYSRSQQIGMLEMLKHNYLKRGE